MPTPFRFRVLAVNSSTSDTSSEHPGMTGDWTLKEKVAEEQWIRSHEKELKEEDAILKASLQKKEIGKLEGELEDILIDEFISDASKKQLISWKMKVAECIMGSEGQPNHAPSSITSPAEKVLSAQVHQAQLLSELENLLHVEGVDLSEKAKRTLIDWKLKQ